VIRETLDLGDQLGDGAEGTATNRLLGNDVEPDLDLIEPRGVRRREVHMIARPRGQPAFDLGVLMGAIVVHDQVDVQVRRHGLVDVLQELQELLMTVPRLALREHLAGGYVESGEQSGRTITDVVVGDSLNVSETQGQERLRALERLHLALLVDA